MDTETNESPSASTDERQPWRVIVVNEPTGVDVSSRQLTDRIRMRVVSTSTDTTSDREVVGPENYEIIRSVLNESRQMFADRPEGVEDAASLRAWATQQLQALRTLLDEADAKLAAGIYPAYAARVLAEAAARYSDGIDACYGDDEFTHDWPQPEEDDEAEQSESSRVE